MKSLIVISCIFGLVLSIEIQCGTDEKCIDRHLEQTIERIDNEESVPLFGGLEIVKTENSEIPRIDLQKYSDDSLYDKVQKYVATHELSYGVEPRNAMEEDARTRKLKRLIIPLLLALKLKLMTVLPAVLTALTLISIKGVFAGLFAIFLSGITALKSLTETKKEPLTAILATPVHSLHGHHHDLRWGRQDIVQDSPSAISVEAYNLPSYAGYQNVAQNLP